MYPVTSCWIKCHQTTNPEVIDLRRFSTKLASVKVAVFNIRAAVQQRYSHHLPNLSFSFELASTRWRWEAQSVPYCPSDAAQLVIITSRLWILFRLLLSSNNYANSNPAWLRRIITLLKTHNHTHNDILQKCNSWEIYNFTHHREGRRQFSFATYSGLKLE
jgi:hypothetical protein